MSRSIVLGASTAYPYPIAEPKDIYITKQQKEGFSLLAIQQNRGANVRIIPCSSKRRQKAIVRSGLMRLTNALFRAGRQPTRPSPLCRSAGLLGAAARAAAAWTSYGGLEKANGIISDLMAHVGELPSGDDAGRKRAS